jgi:hypothetical protein
MRKDERGGVQRDARHAADIGQRPSVQRAVVDVISANGSAGLAQMNAHLMRPARFQATFDKGEISQVFHDADMSNRALALVRGRGTAPTPVAAVAHQRTLDALGPSAAANYGEVAAFDGMISELFAQTPLCRKGACEHHEAAGFVIQTVDSVQFAANLSGQNVSQGRGEIAAAARSELGSLMGMPHCRDSSRFLDDNDMSVAETDQRLIRWTLHHGLGFAELLGGNGLWKLR